MSRQYAINQTVLVFTSLVLGIIGELTMLNYQARIVELHRYFMGFFLVSLSYSIGRPAVLKQLTKSIGIQHFHKHSLYVNLVECIGSIFGSCWGLTAVLALDSFFMAISMLLVFQLLLLVLSITHFVFLMIPHWSYQIDRQEALLKYFLLN